jgi:hypothetical protein
MDITNLTELVGITSGESESFRYLSNLFYSNTPQLAAGMGMKTDLT